jgi:DNA-binding transcriptional MerR regulator
MKRLLSVNEFAKLSGIEKTTLRYWDEIGLFSPVMRDPENNYRCYTPDQLTAVNFIIVLSRLNIPLKTINAIKQNKTPDRIIQVLEEQERKLNSELRKLQENYSVIHERLGMIRYGMRALGGINGFNAGTIPDFTVRHIEEGKYILGPNTNIDEDEKFYDAFLNFRRQAEDMRINLSYPIGGYYRSIDNFVNAPGSPNNFFSSDPNGNSKWPEGDYLTGYSRGYYGDFGDVPERMRSYAKENDLVLNGPVFEIYLHDEICLNDPSNYLVQFSVNCTKKPR